MAICQVLQPILGCNGLFVMQLARGMRKPVRDHIQFGLMGRAERLRRVGSSAPPRRSPINYHIATNRSYLVMVVSGRGGEPSSSFSACFANVAVVVWLTLQFGISRTAQNPLDPDRRLISKPALRYACLSGHTGCQEL
jgi:hypothetical protein